MQQGFYIYRNNIYYGFMPIFMREPLMNRI